MVDPKQQISFFLKGGEGSLKVFTARLNLVARMVARSPPPPSWKSELK